VTAGTVGAATLCVVAGLGGAVQVAVMGRLGERIGTLEALAFATLLTAAICGAVLLVARGSVAGYADGARSPVWLWTGALMSALIIFALTLTAPRIGAAATIGLIIAGNLVMGAAVDHFGLFGLERIGLEWPRLVGLALLAGGAALSLARS
jgi:bacterial/archaeal transporter family-2 protein